MSQRMEHTSSTPLLYSTHTESPFPPVEEPTPLLLWCAIRAISGCDFSFGPFSVLRDLRCAAKIFQLRVVSGSIPLAGRFLVDCCLWPRKGHCSDSQHGWEDYYLQAGKHLGSIVLRILILVVWSRIRPTGQGMQLQLCFCYRKDGMEVDHGNLVSFLSQMVLGLQAQLVELWLVFWNQVGGRLFISLLRVLLPQLLQWKSKARAALL